MTHPDSANRIYQTSFASDNNTGVHPAVMEAIVAANEGDVIAYGDDPFTGRAVDVFRQHFGADTEPFFVMNGTGANVTALAAITRPFEAVICTDCAHINVDECGAPERVAGCKLLPVSAPDGKLTPEDIESCLSGRGDEHNAQPRVVSLTQATETGTVYSPEEMRAIAETAHANGMLVHMDGARICNAAAALGKPLREITRDAGVDVLSFGGTKNGLMYGEAVLFFYPDLAADYRYYRKQATQLASKMRFVAAQFTALLEGNLWLENALHANRMASLLAASVREIPGVDIVQPVESNAVFAAIPKETVTPLMEHSYFYLAGSDTPIPVARWMTSWRTTEEDVHAFAAAVKETVQRAGKMG
ncbi:low specificity L-threonine aldolase [Methanogenium sp. S4BF]|uniref:threonine aldolase family protein n=1 Tax=Methanogenium sp. S4BF TaxID=1789226 RepID=UPI002416CBDD|nr:low specificity L-threonine aldolase [Methanogenium sp. S4BF]WFN34643.1 low specificity L-threonine aldolase [Methanogenium sp. S4BF]